MRPLTNIKTLKSLIIILTVLALIPASVNAALVSRIIGYYDHHISFKTDISRHINTIGRVEVFTQQCNINDIMLSTHDIAFATTHMGSNETLADYTFAGRHEGLRCILTLRYTCGDVTGREILRVTNSHPHAEQLTVQYDSAFIDIQVLEPPAFPVRQVTAVLLGPPL